RARRAAPVGRRTARPARRGRRARARRTRPGTPGARGRRPLPRAGRGPCAPEVPRTRAGFSVTVSTRALTMREPIFASFAHDGTRPLTGLEAQHQPFELVTQHLDGRVSRLDARLRLVDLSFGG